MALRTASLTSSLRNLLAHISPKTSTIRQISISNRPTPASPTPASPTRLFSTTLSKMSSNTADKMSFIDAIANRHTYYGLSKDLPISESRIKELISTAIVHTPSSFNSQSARLVLLFGEEHTAFWDITRSVLKTIVNDEEKFKSTTARLDGFSAGYGTVLFYEDSETVKGFQKNVPLYADKFPQWSEHTSAMHQFVIWTALEAEGLGANLQHYNPVIDEKVAARFDVPKEWTLIAQLVFGGKVGGPALVDKPQKEGRLKVFGEKSA